MRAEELDNLTEDQLQQKANACFAAADDANMSGGFEKLRLHLEAQFYVTALAKKRDERVARRDFRMEVGVILLIAAEIVLAIVFGIVGILEGKGQTKALEDMDASTAATASSMTAVSGSLQSLAKAQNDSLERLGQMNTTLSDSLKATSTMAGATRKQLDILQRDQAERTAQLAKKPKLQIFWGGTPVPDIINIFHPPSSSILEQSDTSMTFYASIANKGGASATKVQLRVVVVPTDVTLSLSGFAIGIQTAGPPNSLYKTYLVNFEYIRAGVHMPMTLTFSFPKGHVPFLVDFTVNADEIETATPLGTIEVKPRSPAN